MFKSPPPYPTNASSYKLNEIKKDNVMKNTPVDAKDDLLGAGERTVKNAKPSRFRKRYRALSTVELKYNDTIKDTAAKLESLINGLGSNRELSLSITHLEETVHWVIKSLTGDNSKTNTELQEVLNNLANVTAD